jgi:hypothetical protein
MQSTQFKYEQSLVLYILKNNPSSQGPESLVYKYLDWLARFFTSHFNHLIHFNDFHCIKNYSRFLFTPNRDRQYS